jgi:carbonic anhydrase/acetyltransferase-like protein (isoleucine patch superfamily)
MLVTGPRQTAGGERTHAGAASFTAGAAMIPGLSSTAEARIRAVLDHRVTDLNDHTLARRRPELFAGHDEAVRALGLHTEGTGPDLTVVVSDPRRRLGNIRVESGGRDNLLFFDNVTWAGNFNANIRILGSDCVLFFLDIGSEYVAIPELFLRGNEQFLFWGAGTSAVGCSIELEGDGQGVVIGDDGMLSAGVWIRNHDMHAMHDLQSGVLLSRSPVTTVIERHVWIGQDALLLSCERVGIGSIIGARALVKGVVGACLVAAGTPARTIRTEVSWGRGTYGMSAEERVSLGLPAEPEG